MKPFLFLMPSLSSMSLPDSLTTSWSCWSCLSKFGLLLCRGVCVVGSLVLWDFITHAMTSETCRLRNEWAASKSVTSSSYFYLLCSLPMTCHAHFCLALSLLCCSLLIFLPLSNLRVWLLPWQLEVSVRTCLILSLYFHRYPHSFLSTVVFWTLFTLVLLHSYFHISLLSVVQRERERAFSCPSQWKTYNCNLEMLIVVPVAELVEHARPGSCVQFPGDTHKDKMYLECTEVSANGINVM